MSFSSGFLTALVYLALIWCAGSSIALLALLWAEWKEGRLW